VLCRRKKLRRCALPHQRVNTEFTRTRSRVERWPLGRSGLRRALYSANARAVGTLAHTAVTILRFRPEIRTLCAAGRITWRVQGRPDIQIHRAAALSPHAAVTDATSAPFESLRVSDDR
jgi:hypothetical protein